MISGSPLSHCQQYFGYNSIINQNGKRIRRMRRTQLSNQKKQNSKCSYNKSGCSTGHKNTANSQSHCSRCCHDNSRNCSRDNSISINQSRSLKNGLQFSQNNSNNNPSKIVIVNEVDKEKQKSILYVEYNYMMEQKNQQSSSKKNGSNFNGQKTNANMQSSFNKRDIKKTFGDYYNNEMANQNTIHNSTEKSMQNISLKINSQVSNNLLQKKQNSNANSRFSNMANNQIRQNYQKLFQHSNPKADSCTQTNIYSKILSQEEIFEKSNSKLSISSKGKRKLNYVKNQKQVMQIQTQKKILKKEENNDYFGSKGNVYQKELQSHKDKKTVVQNSTNSQNQNQNINQNQNQISSSKNSSSDVNDPSNPYKLKKNQNLVHQTKMSAQSSKIIQKQSASNIKVNHQSNRHIHNKMTVPNTPTPHQDYDVYPTPCYTPRLYKKSQLSHNNSIVSNTCSIISHTSRASSVSSSKSRRQQISQKSRIRLSQYSKTKNEPSKNTKISLNKFKNKPIINNLAKQKKDSLVSSSQIKGLNKNQPIKSVNTDYMVYQKKYNKQSQNFIKCEQSQYKEDGRLSQQQQVQKIPTIAVLNCSQNSSKVNNNEKPSIMDSKSTQKNVPIKKQIMVQNQKYNIKKKPLIQQNLEIENNNLKALKNSSAAQNKMEFMNNSQHLSQLQIQQKSLNSSNFGESKASQSFSHNQSSSQVKSIKLIKIVKKQIPTTITTNKTQQNQIPKQNQTNFIVAITPIKEKTHTQIISIDSQESSLESQSESQIKDKSQNNQNPSHLNLHQSQQNKITTINQKTQVHQQFQIDDKQMPQQRKNGLLEYSLKVKKQELETKSIHSQVKNQISKVLVSPKVTQNQQLKVDTMKIQKVESKIQINKQSQDESLDEDQDNQVETQNKTESRNGSYDLYKPKSHHFSKLALSNHLEKKVVPLDLSKKVHRKKSSQCSSIRRKSLLTIQSGRNLTPLNQNDAQNFINYVDQHDLAISFLYLYVENTKELYQGDEAIFQKYEKICFLIQKKHLYQKNKIVKCLKGLQNNIFTLSGLEIPDLFLKKFLSNSLVKEKIQVQIEESKQLFRQFQDTYRSIRKKYPKDPLVKLQAPNDNFTKQIVKLLTQQLTETTETIDHIQQNSSQMSGNTTFGTQILELQQRAAQIMEIIFLLSELNGRKVKKCQLLNVQSIQFDSYYQKNVDLLLSTFEYFEKLKYKDEQNQIKKK